MIVVLKKQQQQTFANTETVAPFTLKLFFKKVIFVSKSIFFSPLSKSGIFQSISYSSGAELLS